MRFKVLNGGWFITDAFSSLSPTVAAQGNCFMEYMCISIAGGHQYPRLYGMNSGVTGVSACDFLPELCRGLSLRNSGPSSCPRYQQGSQLTHIHVEHFPEHHGAHGVQGQVFFPKQHSVQGCSAQTGWIGPSQVLCLTWLAGHMAASLSLGTPGTWSHSTSLSAPRVRPNSERHAQTPLGSTSSVLDRESNLGTHTHP